MVTRFYVDSSAYLRMLLGEPGGEEVRRELNGHQVLSSVLLILEARRNLVRLSRQGVLSPEQFRDATEQLGRDLANFVLRDLTLDLCEGVTLPNVSTPRSLDLAHLRTALWFHAEQSLTRFVSADAAQTLAAAELGLPVKK